MGVINSLKHITALNCRFNTSLTHATSIVFFFNDTATTEIYTLSLHDALPIYLSLRLPALWLGARPGHPGGGRCRPRSQPGRLALVLPHPGQPGAALGGPHRQPHHHRHAGRTRPAAGPRTLYLVFAAARAAHPERSLPGALMPGRPTSPSMGWHARCHARLRQLLAAACCLSALQALQAAAAPVAAADRDLDTDIGMVAAAAAAAAPASTSANTAAAAPDPVGLRLAQHLTPGTLASDRGQPRLPHALHALIDEYPDVRKARAAQIGRASCRERV